MATVYSPINLGKLELSNRFVRSATWEGMAKEDGSCTPALADLYLRLAQGGVGLIISSHAYVSKEGQAGPWQLGLYSDDLLRGLKDMVGKVHQAGGKIAAQLAHAGCAAASNLSGKQPVGPSDRELDDGSWCRGLEKEEIQALARSFALAAMRAKKAGFDAVQIHAAHGYCLSQFLSPYFNQRQDEYGGDIEGRSRIVREVLQAIKIGAGTEYPVLIKINAQDFLSPGFSMQDMLEVCKMLAEEGLEAVELSGGTRVSGEYIPSRTHPIKSAEDEVYYFQEAQQFKQAVDLPLILVGGIRSPEVAENLVTQDQADLISMSRPLVREPDLIQRWRSGNREPAACISDNKCFKPILNGEGIYCVHTQKGNKNSKSSK
ncbi:MAG: NADH:flavin oxidoreductase [Desulfohalobiaceae bacterium]